MNILKYTLSCLLLLHQPFIFYKIFTIEIYAVFLEYLLIFILLANSNLKCNLKDVIPFIILIILAFPTQIFLGNFNYKYEFIFRLFPVIIFVTIIPEGKSIFVKSSVYFLCVNIFFNVVMFILFKLNFPIKEVSTETGLSGVSIYYLSFAVSTAFFTTGNPFQARLQGWAWEPAAFALSVLPLIYMPVYIWRGLFQKGYKKLMLILYVGVLLTKSTAAFISILVFWILKKPKYIIMVLLCLLGLPAIINYEYVINFINNSSLDVRMEQLSQFYSSLNTGILFFGNGYASEEDLGLEMGQTSIVSRYMLYFGLVKIFLVISLIYLWIVNCENFRNSKFYIAIIAIFVSLISLDISLSNIFVGLMISIVGLLSRAYPDENPKKISI